MTLSVAQNFRTHGAWPRTPRFALFIEDDKGRLFRQYW